MRTARALVAAAVAIAVAACSEPAGVAPHAFSPASRGQSKTYDQISIYAPRATTPSKVITDGVDGPDAMTMDSYGNLYVANINKDTVSVYAPGATSPSRTIRAGLGQPVCLAVDSKGNLFVASAVGLHGFVTEYAPASNSVARRIDATVDVIGWHDGQRGLAVDASGNLYVVASKKDRVEVYRPTETTPSRVITDGVSSPEDLAFDRSGNLYVMNGYGNTSVYAPRATRPFAQIAGGANDVAFDSRGRTYASLWNSVVEYAPDRKTVLRTIPGGGINALAVDRYDNLYVVSGGYPFHGGTVTVYSHRDGSLLRTIEAGVTQPSELLFDKGGKLYVASYPHYE